MNIADSDTVVVDLLSNSSFMGSDKDGMPADAVKSNGTNHFTSNMEGAPIAILKKAIGLAGPILRAASQAGKTILLVPLPRYAETKCCQDPGHISNFGEADYSDTIRASIVVRDCSIRRPQSNLIASWWTRRMLSANRRTASTAVWARRSGATQSI